MVESELTTPEQFSKKLADQGQAVFHASSKADNGPSEWKSTEEILQNLTPKDILDMGGTIGIADYEIDKATASRLKKPDAPLPQAFSKDNTPKTIGIDSDSSPTDPQPDILIHTEHISIKNKIAILHMRLSLTDETLEKVQDANRVFDDIRNAQEKYARYQTQVDELKISMDELKSEVRAIKKESQRIIVTSLILDDAMQARINSLSSLNNNIETLRAEYLTSSQAAAISKQEVTELKQRVQVDPKSEKIQLDKLDGEIIQQAINAGNTRAREQREEELAAPQRLSDLSVTTSSPDQREAARKLLEDALGKPKPQNAFVDDTILQRLTDVDLFLAKPPDAKLFTQAMEWFRTHDFTSSQTIVLAGTLLRHFGTEKAVPKPFREPLADMLTPDHTIDSNKLREFIVSRLTVEIGKMAKAQTVTLADLVASVPPRGDHIVDRDQLIRNARAAASFESQRAISSSQSPSEMLWSEGELESLLPHFPPGAPSTRKMLASFDRTSFETKTALFEPVSPTDESYTAQRFQHISRILRVEVMKDADDCSVNFTDILRGAEDLKITAEVKTIMLQRLTAIKTVLATKNDESTLLPSAIEGSVQAVIRLIADLSHAKPEKCIEIVHQTQHARAMDVIHSSQILQSIKDRARSYRLQLPQVEITPELQGSEIQLIFKGALPQALALANRRGMPNITPLGSPDEPFTLTFDLNKHVILITGPNGNGKTVFTKTIAAALLGYPTVSDDMTPAVTIRGNANTIQQLFSSTAPLFEQPRQTGFSTFQTTARNLAANYASRLLLMDEAIRGTNDDYSRQINAALMLAKCGLVTVQHGAAETLTSALTADFQLAGRIIPIVVEQFKPRIGEVAINSGGLGLLTALVPPQELLGIIESLAKEKGVLYTVDKNAAAIARFLTETGESANKGSNGFPAETVRAVGFTNETGGIIWLASELLSGSLATQGREGSNKNPIIFQTNDTLLYQIIRRGPDITNTLMSDENGLAQRTALFDLFAAQMVPQQWLRTHPKIEQVLKQTVPGFSRELKRWFDRKPTERFQLLAIASAFSGTATGDSLSAMRLMTDLARLKAHELKSLVSILNQNSTDIVTALTDKTPLGELIPQLPKLIDELMKSNGIASLPPQVLAGNNLEQMKLHTQNYLLQTMNSMRGSLFSKEDREIMTNSQPDKPNGTCFFSREIIRLEEQIDNLYAPNKDIAQIIFKDLMSEDEYNRLELAIRQSIADGENISIQDVPTIAEAMRTAWIFGQKNLKPRFPNQFSSFLASSNDESVIRSYQVLESLLISIRGDKFSEFGYVPSLPQNKLHQLPKPDVKFNHLPAQVHQDSKETSDEFVYRLQYALERCRHQYKLSMRIPQGEKNRWSFADNFPSWRTDRNFDVESTKRHEIYQRQIEKIKQNLEYGTKLDALHKAIELYFDSENTQSDLLSTAKIMQSRFKEMVNLGERVNDVNVHLTKAKLREISDLISFLETGTLPVEVTRQPSFRSLTLLHADQGYEPVTRFFAQALSLVAVESVMQKNPKLGQFDAATATRQALETATLLTLANLMKSVGTAQPIQTGSKNSLNNAVNLATIAEIVSRNLQAHPNMPIEILFDRARSTFTPLSAYLDERISIIVGPNGSGKSTAETTILQQYVFQRLVNRTLGDVTLQPIRHAYIIGSGKASLDESTFTNSARQIAEVTRAIQHSASDEQVLIVIDEMGTGTNPQEAEIIKKAVLQLLSKHSNVSVIFIDQGKETIEHLQKLGIPLTIVGFRTEHKLEPVDGFIDPDSLNVCKKMGVPDPVISLAASIQ